MKAKEFIFRHPVAVALDAQSVADAGTANGNAIVEPWKDSEELVILFTTTGSASVTAAELKVQRRARVGGAWSDALEGGDPRDNKDATKYPETTTVLKFTAADMVPGAAGNTLVGSIDFSNLPSSWADTYDAIRLVYSPTGAAAVVCAMAVQSGSYVHGTGQTDQLRAKASIGVAE